MLNTGGGWCLNNIQVLCVFFFVVFFFRINNWLFFRVVGSSFPYFPAVNFLDSKLSLNLPYGVFLYFAKKVVSTPWPFNNKKN